MRILLVEPHLATALSVEFMLKSQGWHVQVTADGEDAAEQGLIYDYDMILTEIDLPRASGLDVIRRLRSAKNRTPIMVLTHANTVADRVKAFAVGADDHLTKPFHKDELVARIQAIVRRSKGHAQSVIEVDGLVVDLDSRTISVDGRPIHLTGREYQVVELMALRVGKVLTKEMFLNHLYGGRDEPELKIVDVFMCKVRRKLADATANDGRQFIKTIWGRGYMLSGRDADRLAA